MVGSGGATSKDSTSADSTDGGAGAPAGGNGGSCLDVEWASESTTPSDAAQGCDTTNWESFGEDLRGCALQGVEIPPYTDVFEGVKAFDLRSCPVSLGDPTSFEGSWVCVAQPANDRNAVVARGVDLGEANLAGANLEQAYAPGVNLWGANLAGANLSGAELSGAITHDLPTCPHDLPNSDWHCLEQPAACAKLLIGPGADLRAADLDRVELPEVLASQDGETWYLSGVRATDLVTCPAVSPSSACCLEQPSLDRYALIAPGMSLADADLVGADLEGCDLTSVDTWGLKAFDLVKCPDATEGRCVTQGDGQGYALLAPGVDVSGANLSGVDAHELQLYGAHLNGTDLSGANLETSDLQGADLSDADLSDALLDGVTAMLLLGCPAQLPEPWLCVGQPLVGNCPGEMFGPDGLPLPETACQFALVGPRASLRGIELRFADLSGADLTGADLQGAMLEGTNFDGAVLDGVIWDGAACPDGSSADGNGGTCEGHLQFPL